MIQRPKIDFYCHSRSWFDPVYFCRVFAGFTIGLAIVFLFSDQAFASQLVDVRTGNHRDYSRIVLQFSAPVGYWVNADHNRQSVAVVISKLTGFQPVRPAKIDGRDPLLQNVRYDKKGQMVTILATLKTGNFQIRHRRMDRPFRIVVDIYKQQTPTEPPALPEQTVPVPAESSAVKTTAAAGIDAVREIKRKNIPREVLKHTDLQVRHDERRKNEKTEPVQATSRKTEKPLDLIWVLGITFLSLDGAFLALYFINRRKKAAQRAQGQSLARKRNRHARKHATDEIARQKTTAPSPERPETVATKEPSPQEFVELLKEALKSEDMQTPVDRARIAMPDETAASGEQVDSRPATTSIVLAPDETERPEPPEPPEFEDIVRELYPGISQEELTEERARQQLIGRDGVEFMRNIKKLYLN